MPHLHVAPQNDSKDHLISKDEACWCAPQVLSESEAEATHIHRPQSPVIIGHNLKIQKFLLYPDTGIVVQLDK